MADEKISEVFASDPINVEGADLLGAAQYNGSTYDKGAFQSAQLMRDRYKIRVAIASNNLTVSLQNNIGNTPSANRPLCFKIDDTVRTAIAATSITLPAGTQWFGLGAAFAGLEQDLFVYAIWNQGPVTDIVDIGLSRLPFLTNYGTDTSATPTNEKYFAYGNATAPNAGDGLTLIGRIPVTLSAAASYFWSSPADAAPGLVRNYPIRETRSLAYVPTFGNTTNVNGTVTGEYRIIGKLLYFNVNFTLGASSTVTGNVTITMPFTSLAIAGTQDPRGSGLLMDANGSTYFARLVLIGSSVFLYALAVGGTYLSATAISSTVPFTWTNTDEMSASGYFAIG